MSSADQIRVGVVGLGYWGPNLARNFASMEGCELRWLCDPSAEMRARAARQHPDARSTGELGDLLSDGELDAVAIATPVPTHAELAVRVLRAGKHCLVEKPLATNTDDAQAVVVTGEEKQKVLMVGHLLEYHPAVIRLGELLRAGELGSLYYIYSSRLNLGRLRADENALWSLGAHDVSVLLALIDEDPHSSLAHGRSFVRPGVEDVVFCDLAFPSGVLAHMHLSWLDPHKERRLTVVGSQRMATFDDMLLEGKLTVYDKGFDEDSSSWGEYIARSGESYAPRISNAEPLRLECEHFIECVRAGAAPRSDGHSGLRVVRVLEELQRSLGARSVV